MAHKDASQTLPFLAPPQQRVLSSILLHNHQGWDSKVFTQSFLVWVVVEPIFFFPVVLSLSKLIIAQNIFCLTQLFLFCSFD